MAVGKVIGGRKKERNKKKERKEIANFVFKLGMIQFVPIFPTKRERFIVLICLTLVISGHFVLRFRVKRAVMLVLVYFFRIAQL